MRKYVLQVLSISFLYAKAVFGQNDTPLIEAATEEQLQRVPGRIVNGTRAAERQFPQQVSLRRRYSQAHFCGGSILTPDWILTASHCMLDKNGKILEPYTITVVAGEIALKNTNRARQWSYVKKLIMHPEFNYATLHNDVALLKLESPLKFDVYVKPAPVARTSMLPGTYCQVSGWGYQKYQGNVVSGTLMYVDLPLLPILICRELLAAYSAVPPGMFCAGYLEGGKDACQGDSGGGMLCNGYLTGVVSGGEGCAWPKLPGLYADIKYYLPWIQSYVDLSQNFTVRANPYRNAAASLSSLSTIVSVLFTVILSIVYYN